VTGCSFSALLQIIITGRPDLNIIAQFNRNLVRCKHLDAEGAPSIADVSRYINERVDCRVKSGYFPAKAEKPKRSSIL
jgi:hypothetical protein